MRDKFVVALGDAEDFVYRLNPGGGEGSIVYNRGENGAERFAETQDSKKNGVDGVRLSKEKRPETRGAVFGDEAGVYKKRDELVPGKVVGGGSEIREVEGKATGDERGVGGHITRESLQGGYIRNESTSKWASETLATKTSYP